MLFKLVRNVDQQALHEWPAWGQYYVPSDIESLVAFGYDRETVRSALKAVGWSDDYWFPIPDHAPVGTFEFEHRQALFHTRDGVAIEGYVYNSGHSIGLFGRSEVWVINSDFLDLFEDEKSEILRDLQLPPETDLLPLSYNIRALGGRNLFPNNGANKSEMATPRNPSD